MQDTLKDMYRMLLVTLWIVTEIAQEVISSAYICSTEPPAANPGAAGSNLHEPRCSLHGSHCLCLE